jgi:hypothetical protein
MADHCTVFAWMSFARGRALHMRSAKSGEVFGNERSVKMNVFALEEKEGNLAL